MEGAARLRSSIGKGQEGDNRTGREPRGARAQRSGVWNSRPMRVSSPE